MSPFARGMATLPGHEKEEAAPNDAHSRWFTGARNAWGASVPDNAHRSPLSSSVTRALGTGFGVPSYSTVVGGFDQGANANGGGGGNKSGSSSRRHSVSVIGGGAAGRRDMFGEAGGGMSTVTSPPGRGLGSLGFSDEDLLPEKLGDALNIEIDENRKRGIDIELKDGLGRGQDIPISQSLPRSEYTGQRDTGLRASVGGYRDSYSLVPGPGTSADRAIPARGRPEQAQANSTDRGVSRGSRDESVSRSRFKFDAPSPRQFEPVPFTPGNRGPTFVPGGPYVGGPNQSYRGPGSVGVSTPYDPRLFPGPPPPPPSFGGPPTFNGGGMYQGRPAFPGPGPGMGGPMTPQHGYGGRPPPGYSGFFNGQSGLMQGPMHRPPHQVQYGSIFSPTASPFQPHGSSAFYPQSPTSPNPDSPSSFSQLSLADLGRGIPLGALPPATPLYIVTFKAGRRDIFYCLDPTLLISNGDRVIVEADRGSDLGTVVYDQVTPAEIRDWQEKQATAALLSGASQHQPPGMAVAAQSSPPQKPDCTTGELSGLDLPALLAGVGPGGQLDFAQPPIRGPLAREIMPKRIFTKSSQGPEEQT